ncbi:kielin/chordin-like protein [Orbicella faveolata]|uniref:kielin/chordin-like protein n=1 Tax=Orbicella faveolata TaxID=48498 RepID=UPI0009E18F40|nr:kielin/chordin-like protein [Orbicella faveolata]
MIMGGNFNVAIIFLVALLISSESRFVNKVSKKEAIERRSATCNANNKTYNLGETIVYHKVTDPVENAMCDVCQCSAGGITGCTPYACDLGVMPSLCDNWITKEGRCCPICETCSNNANPWIKRLSSGDCYECSCNGEDVNCHLTWCAPCPGVTVNIPGQCCPQCTPTTHPPDSFTIQWTTTQASPNFPPNFPGFPFRKRDVISPDEQIDDKEHDSKEQ